MKLRELFALELTISRDWLNRHSTNLESQLSKAYRRCLNEKEDVLLFTDFKASREFFKIVFKRLHYQRTGKIRSKRLEKAGTHSLKDIRRLWEIQEGKCYYTAKSLGATFEMAKFAKDHIVPVARKGGNTAYNIALCLPAINADKADMSLKDFIKWKRIPKQQQLLMSMIDVYRTNEFYEVRRMKPKTAIGKKKVYRYFLEMEPGKKVMLVSALPVDLQKYKRDEERKPDFFASMERFRGITRSIRKDRG
jgi:hypothetical protein